MFGNVRSVLVVCLLLLSPQLCFVTGQSQTSTSEDYPKAAEDEHKDPVTSYYRRNIYGNNSYAFGFEVNDKTTGNIQFRDEKRYSNGSVEGSYGYVRPDGSVSITHYKADPEEGYLSQTQNFPPGEEAKWLENWPKKKLHVSNEKATESQTSEATYNDKEKLNLTSILLPVEAIKQQHGIDLNPSELEKEVFNPAVLEVINGEAPLLGGNDEKKDEGIGFATVNKFIPSQFPIVPFELPQDDNVHLSDDVVDNDVEGNKANSTTNAEGDKANAKSSSHKYNAHKLNNSEKTLNDPDLLPPSVATKSRENNDEKAIPAEMLGTSTYSLTKESNKTTPNNKPLPKADNDWYERIINQERQKYLKGLK